jgi:hypothetical protein
MNEGREDRIGAKSREEMLRDLKVNEGTSRDMKRYKVICRVYIYVDMMA